MHLMSCAVRLADVLDRLTLNTDKQSSPVCCFSLLVTGGCWIGREEGGVS